MMVHRGDIVSDPRSIKHAPHTQHTCAKWYWLASVCGWFLQLCTKQSMVSRGGRHEWARQKALVYARLYPREHTHTYISHTTPTTW